jgi:hypothetical protein
MSGNGYLFGRAASLIIGPAAGGNSVDVSNMHFTFTVTRATIGTPQTATIRIYNLADQTANTLIALSPSLKQPDGGQVQLKAGYFGLIAGTRDGIDYQIAPSVSVAGVSSAENLGLIFSGTIKQIIKGKSSQTDTYIDIIAADWDQPYNYSTVQTTLAAGWSQADVAKQLAQALSPYGITGGQQVVYDATRQPRGKVMYGMTRDHGRMLGSNTNCDWTVTDGQIVSVADGGALPNSAIVINDQSGLIGFPQQTLDGIELYTLLNPNIKPGTMIQLDNSEIIDFTMSTAYTATQLVPSDKNDGFYRVYWIERQGDTRGNDWFNHIICVAATAPLPATSTYTETVG